MLLAKPRIIVIVKQVLYVENIDSDASNLNNSHNIYIVITVLIIVSVMTPTKKWTNKMNKQS